MTALVAVSSYLPDERVPIEDLAEQFELTPMQIKVFRRYHKLGEVRVDRGGTLIDLLRGALKNLDELPGPRAPCPVRHLRPDVSRRRPVPAESSARSVP